MATKFLAITFFFSLVVIEPVHRHYGKDYAPSSGNDTESMLWSELYTKPTFLLNARAGEEKEPKKEPTSPSTDFLWMYVAFVYFFSGVAIYLIVTETKRIIRIRQYYLGSQSTVTDRTIRLSGIPPELRSEDKLKETIERLEIGKVESLTICRDWKELDDLMDRRMQVLRKLEEAWAVHLGPKSGSAAQNHSISRSGNHFGEDEESQLLPDEEISQGHERSHDQDRPTTRIWYGFLKLQSQKIDAIDYYEEKLRKLDEKIKLVRKKGFKPMPLAFVTLDSPASCVGFVLSLTSYYTKHPLANGSSGNTGSCTHEAVGKAGPCCFRCYMAKYVSFTFQQNDPVLVHHCDNNHSYHILVFALGSFGWFVELDIHSQGLARTRRGAEKPPP